MYWEVNNINGWVMSQKLPVDGHNEFNEQFIENYDENIDKGCIIEIDIQFPKKLQELHTGNESWIGTTKSTLGNRIQSKSLVEAMYYIEQELRTKVKNDSMKDLFKVMNNLVYGKAMESVRKH